MSAPPSPPGPVPDPLLGRILGGHYRLVQRLGEGSMGVVYRARHTLHDEDVAVKVLRHDLVGDPEVRRRLLLEARSLASFSHRHAVGVRHVGDEDGLLYLVMGLVTGESLAERIGREGPLPPTRAALLAVQALEALEEAHLAGVVHRDVKPANLMLERSEPAGGQVTERLRVVDFGLAHVAPSPRGGLPSALASTRRRVVGTVAYMAPEQVRAEEVDGRADLFALGAVLYEMLTGTRAFPGQEAVAVAARVIGSAPAPWPPEVEQRVPAAVRSVVERALAKDPDERFQSAGQMADALRDAITASPPGPGALGAPRRPWPRRRAARIVAGLLLVGSAAGAGLAFHRAARDGAEGTLGPAARGTQALEQGRFSEAEGALTEALLQRPADVDLLLARAAARRALRDPRAGSDLAAALQAAPNDPRALVARAKHLAEAEDQPEAALALLRQALLQDRSHAPAREERVRIALSRRDLAGAEADVRVLLEEDPDGVRPLAAMARLERRRSFGPGETWNPARLEVARRAAERASRAEPRWAEGALLEAGVLQDLGQAARQRGEDAEAARLLGEAVAAATEAVRRAQSHPGYDAQAADLPHLHLTRAGIHFLRQDFEAALEDVERALVIDPRSVLALEWRAFSLQQLGRHEDALREHERLYDMAQNRDALFRVGFGWQALGMEKADQGDGPGAMACFERALATYATGVERFPAAQEMRTYRGETLTRRAALRPEGAEREEDLAAARADLDGVLAEHPGDSETLLRRAEWALAAGRPESALADAREAVGGRKDRTPRHYLVLAAATLLDPTPSAWKEGVAAATRALDLGWGDVRAAHLVRGRLRVRMGDLGAAEADLVALERIGREGAPPAAARASAQAELLRAELRRARGDAAGALGALRAAVAAREREHAEGRWSLDPTWYERLAEALDATGATAEAVAARERARSLAR